MILSPQIPDPSPDFSFIEANWGWLVLVLLVVLAAVAFVVTMWTRRQDDAASRDVDEQQLTE